MAYSCNLPKWQNSSVALWIEITAILNWRYGMVWYGGGQMTSEFI